MNLHEDMDVLIERYGFDAVMAHVEARRSWRKRGAAIDVASRSLVDEIHWLNGQFGAGPVKEFVDRIWKGEVLR